MVIEELTAVLSEGAASAAGAAVAADERGGAEAPRPLLATA